MRSYPQAVAAGADDDVVRLQFGRNLIGARRFEYISDYISTVPTELVPSLMLTSRWTF